MKKTIKAGIIGGGGYTGGETLRLLLNHEQVEIAFVQSTSQQGKKVSTVHTDLLGETELRFTPEQNSEADVLFLCVGHGEAMKYLEANSIPQYTRIIDLSQDHRLLGTFAPADAPEKNLSWIYGLPELNREEISSASRIANPGCFATSIQLGLLPFANAGTIGTEIHISATTGSTGAGQTPSASTHFSWRQNNLGAYKVFTHQHLGEIHQSLHLLQPDFTGTISFVPYRGSFTRGILSGMYFQTHLSLSQCCELVTDYYNTHPFVHLSEQPVDLKQVVNTNKCLLHLEKQGDKIFITSVIDNLLKGAAGQAVQNMNLMFGMEESAGLKLKASAF
jgi:N-acetyl-gamma-glutamyl-phosphate reductase